MISADQFRDLVAEYLVGDVDLESFSRKFAVLFDDIEDSGNAEAIELSYQIESALADVSAGLASEEALRECLSKCTYVANVTVYPEFSDPLAPRSKSATFSQYAAEYEYA